LEKRGFISEKSKKLFEQCEVYKNTIIATLDDGTKATNYGGFKIVFYGGLAHHNKDYVIKFLNAVNHPISSGLAEGLFINCVKKIFVVCKSLEVDIKKYQKIKMSKT